MRELKFGTLNARGIKKICHNDGSLSLYLPNILSDINKHNLDATAIQESWFGEHEYLQKEDGYTCFFVNEDQNRYHGTGIIIKDIYKPTFKRISPRVCTATFKFNNRHFLFISAYAPHETLSNKNPEERELFYHDLQKALLARTSNSFVTIALDANARTSYDDTQPPTVLGHFTKGDITNNNGTRLIEFAAENDLFLTNTAFQHKMAHRSTWTAPYRPLIMKNGHKRKNPIRNQIDYILTDRKNMRFVNDSRSYTNLHTQTDHNMVIMKMKLDLSILNAPKKAPIPQINTERFNEPHYVTSYRQKVSDLNESRDNTDKSNDEKWEILVKTCEEAGKEALGTREKSKQKQEDVEISNLKERKHRLKLNINGCNSQATREKFEEERKGIQKEITRRLKDNEEKELDSKMKHLEDIKNDNTRYFYVMRDIQKHNRNTKSTIMIKDKEGNIPGTNEGKIQIIEEYFRNTLAPQDMEDQILTVPPCPMKRKFTALEIEALAKKLNNDKAPGPDKLKAEFIKHAPMSTFDQIAEIFNSTAETGDAPKALVHGLLHPVPKPGKKKGPQRTCDL